MTRAARADLLRLVRFFAADDPSTAKSAARALAVAFRSLAQLPFASRVATGTRMDPTLRELVVPFRGAGYLLLFRVTDGRTVSVLAVRHQQEDDYH